jgi:putative transposase
MANTYTQLYIQLVFAVQGRQSLIKKEWKDELYAYTGGIITNNKSKPLAINGMPDHIHIFIGYNPTRLLPELVEEIKTSTNKFLKATNKVPVFNWQKGYAVIKYINNQENHHRKQSFREEYLETLNKFEVEYKDNYLFDFQDVSSWES